MQHYGLGLKMLANEKKGDGIMSAIDIFVSMDMIKGKMDEDRFVITLNGKFLPHLEQLTENNTAALGQKKEWNNKINLFISSLSLRDQINICDCGMFLLV